VALLLSGSLGSETCGWEAGAAPATGEAQRSSHWLAWLPALAPGRAFFLSLAYKALTVNGMARASHLKVI